MEYTRRTWLTESIMRGSHELIETETVGTGPACVYRRSSAYVMTVSSVFCETPNREWVSLALFLPAPSVLFLLLSCLVLPDLRAFALSYCILFCPIWAVISDLLETYSF